MTDIETYSTADPSEYTQAFRRGQYCCSTAVKPAPVSFRLVHSSGKGPPVVTENQPKQYAATADEARVRARNAYTPGTGSGGRLSRMRITTMPTAAETTLAASDTPIRNM
ncbi:hypothetical protein ACFXAE_12365 [Streptomyces sp. NPDC059454]|uniref:hypothetical protein n=1 Tax=Streptomyces sp. NPDC059454 TaxID=3346836 RepID=UPI0036B43121